jgi:hypothetical protein
MLYVGAYQIRVVEHLKQSVRDAQGAGLLFRLPVDDPAVAIPVWLSFRV